MTGVAVSVIIVISLPLVTIKAMNLRVVRIMRLL
jgi:hypothetical protein